MGFIANGKLVPEKGGDPIPLVRQAMTVGRLDSCDICLRLPNVSKTHCKFVFEKGYWVIEDLKSTNGIKVNGERVNRKVLHPNDKVSIGKRTFILDYEPPADSSKLEEIYEDNPLKQSLLEKAGLTKPGRKTPPEPMRKRVDWKMPEPEDDDED